MTSPITPARSQAELIREWESTEYGLRNRFKVEQRIAILSSEGPTFGKIRRIISQDRSYGIEAVFNDNIAGVTPTTQWVSPWDLVDATNVPDEEPSA